MAKSVSKNVSRNTLVMKAIHNASVRSLGPSSRVTQLITIMALSGFLAGCDSEPPPPSPNSLATAAGQELLATSARLCAGSFGYGLHFSAPTSGSVAGPAVALIQYDKSLLEERFRENLPPLTDWKNRDVTYEPPIVPLRVLATSKDSVGSVVCVRQIYNLVGFYENNVPGVRLDWDVRVLRWPAGELIGGMVFRGPDPEQKAHVEGYCNSATNTCAVMYSGDPRSQVHDWLDGIITR